MINGIKSILILLLLSFAFQMSAQQATVKDMRRRVTRLQQQIKEKERILLTAEKDVASKLKNLNLLTARIGEHKALVTLLTKEVALIDDEIKKLSAEVSQDEKRVEKSKEEYAAALRRARRYGTMQDKLLFIVSADNFNSMLHRYRYTREYMNAHRTMADELKKEIDTLEAKRAEVEKIRAGKVASLEEQRREEQSLKSMEEQQRSLVAELKRENNKVKKELTRQRSELNKLNAAIDREIERELEEQRKAEALAAKKKKTKKQNCFGMIFNVKLKILQVFLQNLSPSLRHTAYTPWHPQLQQTFCPHSEDFLLQKVHTVEMVYFSNAPDILCLIW